MSDPTYGYDLDRLLQVEAPAGPADFADFWQRTYEETRRIPLEVELREVPCPDPATVWQEVDFNSFNGFRTGGWITAPRHQTPEMAVVVGHGYDGREAPDVVRAGPPSVRIYPCARGFHRSSHPDIPDESNAHVLAGIETRESYLHRGCVAEVWSAVSVLEHEFPALAGRIHYRGGSFGGGIGALAMPWDPRIRSACLDVPSFGNHPLRVHLPCCGSGRAVSARFLRDPSVLKVLAYFDAATAARYIRIPVMVAPALADPSVPPPGQFAIWNALPGEKELFVRTWGHPTVPSENEALDEAWHRWLDRLPPAPAIDRGANATRLPISHENP